MKKKKVIEIAKALSCDICQATTSEVVCKLIKLDKRGSEKENESKTKGGEVLKTIRSQATIISK